MASTSNHSILASLAADPWIPFLTGVMIGAPSALLYICEVLLLVFHRKSPNSNFQSSFFQLFVLRSIPVTIFWNLNKFFEASTAEILKNGHKFDYIIGRELIMKTFRHCSITSIRTFTCDLERLPCSGQCLHRSRNGHSVSFFLVIIGLFMQKTSRLECYCWIGLPPSNFPLSTKRHIIYYAYTILLFKVKFYTPTICYTNSYIKFLTILGLN